VDTVTRDLRMSVAIPCDFRLTACAALDLGVTPSGDWLFQTIDDCPDMDRIEPTLDRLHYVDAGRLYQLWLRQGVFGDAESALGSALSDKIGVLQNTYPPNIANAVRSDGAQISAHARKALLERGRLTKQGSLRIDGYLLSEYPPGTAISWLNNLGDGSFFPIRAVVGEVKWACGELFCYTELRLV